ncbi:MAG: hypothetical protein JWR75_1478 [Devosia sp.]|nr:hypothetical protein [Devosia sp.]
MAIDASIGDFPPVVSDNAAPIVRNHMGEHQLTPTNHPSHCPSKAICGILWDRLDEVVLKSKPQLQRMLSLAT